MAENTDAQLRELIGNTPLLTVEKIAIELDPQIVLEGISAVTADGDGNIYILHRPQSGDPIVVVDRSRKLIRSWGRGLFVIPHGIRLDSSGNVWVTESSSTSKVIKFSNIDEKLLDIDISSLKPDYIPEVFFPGSLQVGATDIAFGPDDTIYITDGYANARVLVFDANGVLLQEWGSPGDAPGQFRLPHSIAIRDNVVYVADRENGRLQWFDLDGTPKGQWNYGGQFYNLAFGPEGEIWASTHPKDVPLDNEFNVVQLDPTTGKMLGRIEVRSHELAIASDGVLLPATRSSNLVLFRVSETDR